MTDSIPSIAPIAELERLLLSNNQEMGRMLKETGLQIGIDKINWQAYSFAPTVRLYLAYSDHYLWLHYEVSGDYYRAEATSDQEAVWEDSCVEFFISMEQSNESAEHDNETIVYRNFEFNVGGVCLSAVGTKHERNMLPNHEMEKILRFPFISGQSTPPSGELFDWELTVAIPLEMLSLSSGQRFRANFYKCGDLTKIPHFLSWSTIASSEPDFHLPAYFGAIQLVQN